jgi:hypothetical protein
MNINQYKYHYFSKTRQKPFREYYRLHANGDDNCVWDKKEKKYKNCNFGWEPNAWSQEIENKIISPLDRVWSNILETYIKGGIEDHITQIIKHDIKYKKKLFDYIKYEILRNPKMFRNNISFNNRFEKNKNIDFSEGYDSLTILNIKEYNKIFITGDIPIVFYGDKNNHKMFFMTIDPKHCIICPETDKYNDVTSINKLIYGWAERYVIFPIKNEAYRKELEQYENEVKNAIE